MADSHERPAPSLTAASATRLLAYLKPHRGRMALAVLSLLASTGLGLAFPLVIVQLLDTVTQAEVYGPLNQLALALVGVFLLQAVFTAAQSYLLSYIGEHVVYDLRTAVFRQLQRLSLDFYSGRRVGDIVSRLTSDVTQIRGVLTTDLTMMLSQALSLIGAVAIVLRLNPRLTLFILALLPLIVAIAAVFGTRVRRIGTRVQDMLAAATVVAEEVFQAIRVVKSFGREEHESRRYDAATGETFRASLSMAAYNALFAAGMMFLGFSSIAAILWFGGHEVIAGRMTIGMVTGFLMYGITIATSLGGLAGLYGQFRAALGGVERVFELLDAQPTVRDTPGAISLPPARGRVTFDDVSFAYESGSPVLEHVSLEVEAGEVLALVGPSGAGKSTMLNLIPRFYDPSAGAVLIDDHDLRDVTQESLRDQIAVVPQDTILFGGTVRDNILYGRLDATREEMISAAHAANAHDFISALPRGYDTIVGERGMNLSGGQRQRIAIARAILRNPPILLLDEATSSLDSESEALVQEALERLMSGRTTIIIAHRLSTTRFADRIAVLEEGRIVEEGTHEQLMALGGAYARAYSMQLRERVEGDLTDGEALPAGASRPLPAPPILGANPLLRAITGHG